jgi:hypothetical protein
MQFFFHVFPAFFDDVHCGERRDARLITTRCGRRSYGAQPVIVHVSGRSLRYRWGRQQIVKQPQDDATEPPAPRSIALDASGHSRGHWALGVWQESGVISRIAEIS